MATADGEPRGEPWVPLGVLGRAQGLQGEVRFQPYNPGSDTLRAALAVRVEVPGGAPRRLSVARVRRLGDVLGLCFEGVGDRTGAEALRHGVLSVPRSALPALGEGEYYHVDLPGCRVLDEAGALVGEVLAVNAYPTADAVVVRTPRGERELPLTEGVLLSLDLGARTLTVDLSALED
ncbi:MAG: 16S rRNA processing protein RimM [Deltaproteobacteria bacterium]|nr:16S rRNA processing protein RimM [Deltaproteobacteria bacterium]